VVAEMEVAVGPRTPADPLASLPWESVRDALPYRPGERSPDDLEACLFRTRSSYVRVKRAFSEYAAECFPAGRPILAAARDLAAKIHREITYEPGATSVGTPLLEVLERRRGVCQDYAHLTIACL